MTIKYIFWNDNTGYGTSGKQIIRALTRAGIKVIPVGLEHNTKLSAEYQLPKSIDPTIPYDIVFIHSAPYYIARLIEPGKINIAYCTWETSILPQKWCAVLNQCSAIFVPSTFNRHCFEQSGVNKPIMLLPHISEFSGISKTSENNYANHRPFTFYSVGMWTNRKNYLELIRTFKSAFHQGENVQLVIKTSKKDYTRPAYYFLRKLGFSRFNFLKDIKNVQSEVKNDPRIIIHTEDWPAESMIDLHRQSDCYISLCKSEGWGLGAYEAAWYGKPVIITGYGGQLDFLKAEVATLLPYTLVNINEKVWTEYNTENQQWADVNIDASIKSMQLAYKHPVDFQNQGLKLKQHLELKFNERLIIDTFIQELSAFNVKP